VGWVTGGTARERGREDARYSGARGAEAATPPEKTGGPDAELDVY